MHAVIINAQTLPGVPVFRGTTVPVEAMFEEIESGGRLEDFLDAFPVVSRDLALEALEEAKVSLFHAAEVVAAPTVEAKVADEHGPHPELKWLRDHGAKYRGEWVALDGYKLFAHGEDGKKVYREAKEAGVKSPFMDYIEVDPLPFAGF